MAAETIAEKVAKTIAEEVAEKAAETMEAVAEVTAETVAEEMAENVTKEEAETEIVSVKAAETEEVVKRKGSPLLNTAKHRKFSNKKYGQKWALKSYNLSKVQITHIKLVTIPLPSAFLTPTQEKIALLELEMSYLQVRSCLSQVRIIRISQQTLSLTVCLRFGQHPNKFQ